MTFRELKTQLDKLDPKQLNQEVYIRFIDKKINFQTIHLITLEHSNMRERNIDWAWLFAQPLSTKLKYKLKNQEEFIVKPLKEIELL